MPLLNFLVLCLGAWLSCAGNVWSDEATWAPRQAVALHVDGKYLKDDAGHIVRLQGVHTTPQPYFTGGGAIWNNHDFEGCLNYMRSLVDVLTDPSPRYGTTHGWHGNQIRMDSAVSYWASSSTTPVYPMEKLKEVTDRILVPLAEYAERKGLYLVLFPDVSIANNSTTLETQQTLLQVWDYWSSHPKLKNSPNVHFEICNEPIKAQAADGSWGSGEDRYHDALVAWLQPVVDKIRSNGANNVIWLPGLGWQSEYAGFARNPVKGQNLGCAVHFYPAYGGMGDDPAKIRAFWAANVQPAADKFPINITEMLWFKNLQGDNAYWSLFNGITGNENWGFGTAVHGLLKADRNTSWCIHGTDSLWVDAKPQGALNIQPERDNGALPNFNWSYEFRNAYDVRNNLLSNGDFSANAAAYTTWPGDNAAATNPSAPTHWTVGGTGGVNGFETVSTVFFDNNPANPNAGRSWTSSSGRTVRDFYFQQNAGGTLAQPVTTTAGHIYGVTFDAATRNDGSTGRWLVSISGATCDTGIGLSPTQWQGYGFSFVGTGTANDLVFQGMAGQQNLANVALNDISGVWKGGVSGTLGGSDGNFADGSLDLATAAGYSGVVYFNDKDGVGNAVGSGALTTAAGGVVVSTLQFNNNAFPYTLGSTDATGVTGATTLIKYGGGRLTLTGAHTNTGGTTIHGGTLSVVTNSAGKGSITINNGGTLLASDGWVFGGNSPYGTNGNTVPSVTVNVGGVLHLNDGNGHLAGITNLYLNGGSVTGGANEGAAAYYEESLGALFMASGNEQITAGGSTTSTISAKSIGLYATNNTITVHAGSTLNITSVMKDSTGWGTGGGFIKAGDGTLTLGGTNSYTGNTTVNGGTLLVNGNNSAATGEVSVTTGATIGGSGTVGGTITMPSGATLAPGSSVGTLTASSSVTIGGRLAIEIDGANCDRLAVVGNLNITNATLDLSILSGGPVQSEYILATFGSLTGTAFAAVNGLPGNYRVEYDSAAKQVKLVRLAPSDGTWSSDTNGNWFTSANWLNATIASDVDRSAIFNRAAGGMVAVDLPGQVIGRLVFANGNYTLTGNGLTLNTPSGSPTISVGAGVTATLAVALAGSDGLTKTGSGKLTLTGMNNYTGATLISGGTLKLALVPLAPVPGMTRWFDASNLGVANGAGVSQWNDRSGNYANAAVPGGNGTPTYIADAGTGAGLGALNFTAVNNATDSQAYQFTRVGNIRSVFSIFKGSSFLLTDAIAWDYDFHRPSDTNPADPLWGISTSASITGGTTYVNGTAVNGASYPMPTNLHNGYNLVEVFSTGNVAADGLNKDRGNLHSGNQSHGEVLIYDFVLTEEQRLTNERYLNYKWFGIGTAGPVLPTTTAVKLSNGGILDMGGGQQNVGELWVNGIQMPAGVYSSSNSAFLTGAGNLTVTGGSSYANWSGPGGYNLAGGSGADDDADGIANILEYVCGSNPTQNTPPAVLPTGETTGGNFVFRFRRVASTTADTTQVFQYGTSLAAWTDVPLVNGGMVSIQPNTPQPGLEMVTVTVPAGSNHRLFGRIKASLP